MGILKAPQIFEKWRKANCDSIIHQNFTPSSDSIHTADTKSRSETDYNSFKDLDSLRLLLTEAKDQNEKRRIRHAMRQLRERERNRQSHGLKNCAVNGRISSLSRSQSLIDDKVQVILQAENNWKLPDKRLVSHSSSFTCGLTKQERKPDSKKDFFNESLQDHTINSSQIRRWCSRSDRSERRKKFVKDESRDRDPKIPLEDNIDSCRPTGYQILSEVETSQLVDNTVPARCTCAEVSSVPSSASKRVSILSETLDESEPTRVNPEFNDNRSSKSLNFNNTSKTDISKKHEIHSHSSILNVMLKHSPNYRRRNSESVYVKKKHAPKKSLPINQSSDQEFQDWLEDKKRTLVLPGLGFDDLNSTREMEAAFSDILDEVDNHSDASDYTSVTCPLEEMRVCRGNPEDILEEEIVENKLHRKKVSYTKQVGERHEDIGEKLEKKVGLKQLEGLTKDVIANNLVIHGDNRECNNNIRKDHVLKHNMVLDLTRFQDKNSAISVIEDDGSVIIQQVTQKDEGNKVVTEVTKLRRTESCTEEEEKDKIIESRGISNEGASVYQKDITKTKKKLTARGSEYFSRNNTIIKRIKKRDGPEYLQHNVCIENDNFSATKGESWGDRAFTQVQLNRSVQQAFKKDQDALNHLNVSKTNSHYRSEEVSVICPPAAKPAGSPEIVCPLKDVTAPDGSTCCLMCVVRATPAPTITWYQNGDQLDMLDSIMTSYDEASGETVLEISAVTSYQSGEYRCVYRNLLGEAETAARLTVNTSTIPVFTKGLQDVTVDEGQSAILECCVPDCKQIFWYKDGTKRRNSSDFKQTYDGLTARLEISELIFGDGGEYACMGKNEIGETMTVCRINVKECLFESVVVPTFLTKPCSQIVGDHEQIVIECEVIGSPQPKVIWLKDGQEIVCNTRTKASFDGRVAALKIGRACLEDSGKYDCVLDNSAGRVSADAILIVRERKRAPFIVHELSDATVVAGKPFTFHCSIMGNPRPTILWRKDHCMIGDTKDFHQSYNDNVARLEVSEIYEQDGGFYECVATNNLGEAITNCHLCIKVSKSKPIQSTSTGAGSKQENAKCTKQTNARQDFTSLKVLEHSDLIPEQNSKFQQADTVTLSTAQITSSKYKYQRDNTVTSYAPKINSEKNKFTEETQNSKSCDQKSNCINSKTFMSWQAEPIKNSWTLRRTESLKLPQKSDSENREILVSHRIGSDENIFKSPSFHCKLDGINKFEKIMRTEQKPKPWQGVKLRRTESARLPSKESPSPLWKNLMVRNTKFSVDKFDQEKPVEVRRSTPRTKLLFECKASADDEENAFSRLVAEVTPLEKKGVALTRTSSLKILPTRKQTGLSRSGSLKLPENEERSAVSSLVAQKRQFWEASSTKMPSYEHIMDEEELHKLLSQTENIEERKKIRGRMRELHEIRTKEWEKKKEQREIGMEDAVRKRFEQAELAKKRQLQAFQDMAAKPTSDRLNKYSSTMDEHIREKHAQADADKKKTLEAYDRMAAERACGGKSFTTVSTEKVVGPVGAATKKSETSVSHQIGIGGTSYGRPAQAKPVGGFTGMSPQASGGTNRLATPGASGQGRGGPNITRNPSAIKQLLLEWSKSKVVGYENVNVTNFSSSWNTGMAFCALIHHFYPEAFDFNKLNPKNRRYNFNLAFDTAEKYADIAPLLDTDDMVKMKNPDWKCVFTYIQSFYRALRDHD